jgi:hypothetical protein
MSETRPRPPPRATLFVPFRSPATTATRLTTVGPAAF